MRTLPALFLALAIAAAPASAQRPVAAPSNATLAEIAFPNAVHREAEVALTFREVPAGPLEVRMARSSPGRYAAHDFAKNVYAVRATDADGRALPVERVRPNVWRVSGHRGTVRFAYTLFADRADGTYAGVDETRAHLNIPATFAYAPAVAERPIYATFTAPNTSWRIATQLEPTSDPRTFRAPHLQYFMDSPTHLGALDIREWQAGPANDRQTIRLALNHLGSRDDATRFTEMTTRVVDEMAAVFGGLPRFDFGTYTFISCYRPNCAGDGMEHRNSTSLTSSGSIAQAGAQLLGTVSHEFFHAWNVERIRPAALEPFDFSDANMSGELWFAEGFTSYYGPLVIHRAGLTNTAQYARQISGAVNTLTTHPGRRFFGPVGMSQQAPFVDAAASIDPNNRANMFISYYTYGDGIALALDLSLRARGKSLDALMQEMWRRFGAQTSALAPARGYAVADIEAALAAVSGDAAFARDFFARFIIGSELPDYTALLARAGFLLRPAAPQAAWIGDVRFTASGGGALVGSATTIGSPLYEAGLDAGDVLTAIADRPVRNADDVARVLGELRPGQSVPVSWESTRSGRKSGSMTVQANPRVEVVPFEDAGRTPSAEQLAFRRDWLGSRQQ